jgi:hypothetical protein
LGVLLPSAAAGRWRVGASPPIKVGKVKDYPSEEAAWRRVEELHLNPNQFEVGAKPLFGELAAHYIQKELPEDQTQATIEKAYSTIRKYKRYLSRWALPRWGTIPALAVHPPDVEDWLRELKKKFELRNPTLGEIRKAMNNVYVHGQRQGFLPRTTDGNPISFVRQSLASDFEPVILTLPQVLDIFDNLDLMRRTMVLTDAATALRASAKSWPSSGTTWISLTISSKCGGPTSTDVSARRRRRHRKLPCPCIRCWRRIFLPGARRRSIPETKTSCFPVFA